MFAVTTSAIRNLKFTLNGGGLPRSLIHVYDFSGANLASAYGSSGGASISLNDLAPGTYYFQIYGRFSYESGAYTGIIEDITP